ncbi:MAG: thiamine pyrophosphate-dependent enzyme, partial [Microvirga sp.]
LGCAALSAGEFCHRASEAADVLVNIGPGVIEKPPCCMQRGGTEVIHVSVKTAEVDPVYFPQIEVIGDIANAIWQMKEDVVPSGAWNFDFMMKARKAEADHTASLDGDARFPIFPPYLVRKIRDAMPADGIICLDNGVYKIWFARNYPARQQNTVLLDNALATMGAGLPSAMMAAMLHPDRRVLAVCGDGGFMMNSQEMETAVRLGLDLVVLILEDSAYGMIRWKQAVDSFPDWGLTFGNPDFVKYAESYGAKGTRVTATEDLVPALEAAFRWGGVHLVVVPIDYSENTRVLVEELGNKVPEVEPA